MILTLFSVAYFLRLLLRGDRHQDETTRRKLWNEVDIEVLYQMVINKMALSKEDVIWFDYQIVLSINNQNVLSLNNMHWHDFQPFAVEKLRWI
jgi:hypothetical protein